jgi:outer membrane receptor for ferrienterochelin and colicins
LQRNLLTGSPLGFSFYQSWGSLSIQEKREMKQFKLVLCILTFILPFTSFAQAQEVRELGKIVVTATMTEKEIEKAPGSIEVITSQEIKDINAQTIAETLEIATGLILSDESGRVKGLSIRGTGNKRALVLIDGRRFSLGYKSVSKWSEAPAPRFTEAMR